MRFTPTAGLLFMGLALAPHEQFASSFVRPNTSVISPRASSSTPSSHQRSSLPSTTSDDNGASTTTTQVTQVVGSPTAAFPTMPSHSPATSLPNQIYDWRGYKIRYQVSGPADADHTLLLVHGLFVNSDHWRKTLTGLHTLTREIREGASNGDGSSSTKPYKTCRVYALDLLGSGWSSKPNREDENVKLVDGENGRFLECDSKCYRELIREREQRSEDLSNRLQKIRSNAVLENVSLGTPSGGRRTAPALELRHPLHSPYNFFTWAEQITDFVHDIIYVDHYANNSNKKEQPPPKVTLVANSIGSISSLQSIIDEPNLFNGAVIINPNFRELHMAEVPFSQCTMPVVRQVQSLLRSKGHGLFKSLANPSTVSQILKEPYKVSEAIDDELVSVLLDPLLTPGADDVVFDMLSYSAGPLPEQQLSILPEDAGPVWVIYGKDDPWTPSQRVEKLSEIGREDGKCGPVEKIVGLDGVGHCPHDESPEVVNRLILEFLDGLNNK